MNVSRESLTKAGYSNEALRKKFKERTASSKIDQLVELAESRIREGVERCLTNAPIYRAIDDALEAPLNQVNHTIARLFASKRPDGSALDQDSKALAHQLGIDGMLQACRKTDGTPIVDQVGNQVFRLDVQTYFRVFVPIVLAYCKSRHSRIWNMHNEDPFLDYQPRVPTRSNKILCRVVSQIGSMACEVGAKDALKQLFWEAIVYQKALMLPREPWWRSMVKNPDGTKSVSDEGVRYSNYHPTRWFCDMSHPYPTINGSHGVEWYGGWDIHRVGNLKSDDSLWLEWADDGVSIEAAGNSPFYGKSWDSFSFLYPTSMSLPRPAAQANDRVHKAFTLARTEHDKGVPVVSLFMKLIPSHWDLFDYEEPVWIRYQSIFERTPIKVEPWFYRPGVGAFYDEDSARAVGSSLALEVAPFQDHVGMLLSEYLDAVRSNSLRLVLYDANSVPSDVITRIQSPGPRSNPIELIPMDFDMMRAAGVNGAQSLFAPVAFPNVDSNQLLRSIDATVSLMERVLGFSAQEVGAPGQASQTATSVQTTSNYVQERHRSTSDGFSAAKAGLKDSIYGAFMDSGSDEIVVSLEELAESDVKTLEALSFNVEAQDGVYGIKGPKTLITAMRFASRREGLMKGGDAAVAAQMIQFMQVVFSKPEIVQAIGIQSAIDWFNAVATFAGLPVDIRLQLKQQAGDQAGGPTPEQVAGLIQKISGEMIGQASTQIQEGVSSELQQVREEITDAIRALVARISQTEGKLGIQPT